MTLVAGVDSSTQSCKVVIRDLDSGALVRHGSASHPDGTEVDPAHWESALHSAIAAAGGIDDVAAISIGGQQHGAVFLDAGTQVAHQLSLRIVGTRNCRSRTGAQVSGPKNTTAGACLGARTTGARV